MGLLDKIKAAATDPDNQAKVKELARKQMEKRKAKGHRSHGHGEGEYEESSAEVEEGEE